MTYPDPGGPKTYRFGFDDYETGQLLLENHSFFPSLETFSTISSEMLNLWSLACAKAVNCGSFLFVDESFYSLGR
jgi:hypothetical protein